jgi:hypothetical protein
MLINFFSENNWRDKWQYIKVAKIKGKKFPGIITKTKMNYFYSRRFTFDGN